MTQELIACFLKLIIKYIKRHLAQLQSIKINQMINQN